VDILIRHRNSYGYLPKRSSGHDAVQSAKGTPKAALDEVIEHSAPSLRALAAHLLDR
jgi:hypothetical protein